MSENVGISPNLVDLMDRLCEQNRVVLAGLQEAREGLIALREAGESLSFAEQGIRVTLEMDGVKRGFSIPYIPIAQINSSYVAKMVQDTIDAHVSSLP